MRDELDDLLARPLEEPADNGFTARVMLRIADRDTAALRWQAAAIGVSAVAVVAVFPFTALGDAFLRAASFLTNAPGMGLAAAALAFSLLLERMLARG